MSSVYSAAVSRIRASAEVANRLGQVNVAPPASHSSSSSSANGVSMRQESMLLPVSSPQHGTAQAQVMYMESGQMQNMSITVGL